MIDMRRTGRQLKENCDEQGISVRQIQKRLHIGSFQSIYAWFCGKTLPNLDNFYALAKMLGKSMESLIIEKSMVSVKEYVIRGLAGGLILELYCQNDVERYLLYEKRLHCRFGLATVQINDGTARDNHCRAV